MARMLELALKHPRYGYRRIRALLVTEGWQVNRKRVHRLWRREGLKVPQRVRRRKRSGSREAGCSRLRTEHPNDVWAWDFIHDRTVDGRALKWFSVVDEFTRECVALEVDRSVTSTEVVHHLMKCFARHGSPKRIRSDNGPEFIAKEVRDWLAHARVGPLYVEPGAPWQNGYAESFHSRLRDELLNVEEFTSLMEAKVLAKHWREDYNRRRPHSALESLTESIRTDGFWPIFHVDALHVKELPHGETPAERRVMGTDRAAASGSEATKVSVSGSKANRQPKGANGHSLRAEEWHPVGDASARDGMRVWDDLLETSARLATSRCLAEAP